MIYILQNAVAILVATLAGLAFGAVYHQAARHVRPPTNVGAGTLVTIFVSELWLCAILAGALILAPAEGGVWTMTLGSAVVIRTIRLRTALVDCGHWLGAMLVQAVVLRLIGLVVPV
jgi:hypothetical protein